MKLLALDLSSSTIGYSIFDEDTKELLEISYYKYQSKDLLDKGLEVKFFIKSLLDKYEQTINRVAIEERLQKFSGGKSSISIILLLSSLNYITQYLVKHEFNLTLCEVSVLKARKFLFPNIFKETRLIKQKQKEYVFEKVLKILDTSLFPKKIMKSGSRKGQEVHLEECGDMADSWVVGKFALVN